MRFGKIGNYWNQTETFEALQVYIDMNFDNLKDDILSTIAGEKIPVNTGSFANDMTTFRTEDDVLTLLIHLGYLAYDAVTGRAFIPNSEVRSEFVNTVSVSDWGEVSKALKDSADTLNAIWQGKRICRYGIYSEEAFPGIPALVIELKWDKSAKGALEQIKRRKYCKSLEEYKGNILLVGINYDKKTKEHECVIERGNR